MTVAELRAALEALPADWTVVLARDANGTAYTPLWQVGRGTYHAGKRWHPSSPLGPLNAALLWPVPR